MSNAALAAEIQKARRTGTNLGYHESGDPILIPACGIPVTEYPSQFIQTLQHHECGAPRSFSLMKTEGTGF